MAYSKRTSERSADLLVERIALAQRRIQTAVAALQSGEEWRSYLVLQSRLHTYSARNVWLLSTQHHQAWVQGRVAAPWPTYVAGFRAWQALGRSVVKGQHGYQILAPNRHLQRTAIDGSGNTRPVSAGDDLSEGERVEARQILKGFRIEHVWAAEQTTGAPLPEPPAPRLLRGQAPEGLWEAVAAQIRSRGFAVRLVPSAAHLGGANGRVTWEAMLVQVRSDMDDAAKVRSLIHELGHCILHRPGTTRGDRGRSHPGRGMREVEAESVAFIVADAHGVATDDYSFPVSTWAGVGGEKAVQAAAARVAAAAKEIITASTIEHTSGGRVPVWIPLPSSIGNPCRRHRRCIWVSRTWVRRTPACPSCSDGLQQTRTAWRHLVPGGHPGRRRSRPGAVGRRGDHRAAFWSSGPDRSSAGNDNHGAA